MRNLLVISILVTLFSMHSTAQIESLSCEEIWNNYLQTLGKKEELLKIKSYSSVSKTLSKYGEVVNKLTIKYPDKIHQEMKYPNGAVVTYIINGNSGIVKHPNGQEKISNEEFENFKEMCLIFPELYFDERGYKIELIGAEEISDKECYNLKIDTHYESVNYIINSENFQLFRITSGNYITEILETEIINGARMVKKMRSIFESDTMETSYSEYRFNVELPDNLFELK